MKKIESLQNPEIKRIVTLHSSKGRQLRGHFIAEGLRTVTTLAQNMIELHQLYVIDETVNQVTAHFADDLITLVTPSVMNKISTASTPSNILAIFKIPVAPSPDALQSGIVLGHISDPGNMGTLIRSCVAFGFKSVVVIGGTDPWGPKVVQSTAGMIGAVDIFEWDWYQLQEHKKDKQLCALVVKDGKHPNELKLKNFLLLVGSEAHGLPQEWIDECKYKLTIPMPGNAESLNAAVAGSIALYLCAQK